ncbi:MAG: hotdog fold thioesterase [Streptosporangiales bacterium]|nr:hotdog fold thioesterase [Streptosporangiales bacterium]
MSTESAQQQLLVMDGGPERAFRVGRAAPVGDGSGDVAGAMVTGPWLAGPEGAVPGGSLGVLVDNTLAFALLHDRRYTGKWSVSAQISVDLCAPVPADGTLLTARCGKAYFGEKGGLATGTVTAADGTLIAHCAQHTRWIASDVKAEDIEAFLAAREADSGTPASEIVAAGGPASLTELLDTRVKAADGGAIVELPVVRELANPLGNLHGGITFAAVDLAAQAALRSAGAPVHAQSIRVAYPRPLPPGQTVRFEAQVVHRGRSLGLVDVTAGNEAGKPCVVASVTTGPVPF